MSMDNTPPDYVTSMSDYKIHYEADEHEPLSEAVITAVSAATGAAPLELTPLYDVIDPDGLDALFRADGPPTNGLIAFPYEGVSVTVHSTGQIVIEFSA